MYIVCWQTEGRTRQGGRKVEQHYKVYDSEGKPGKPVRLNLNILKPIK